MKTYHINIKDYPGSCEAEFDDSGTLVRLEHTLPFTHEQLSWLFRRITNSQALLDANNQQAWGMKVVEVKLNPSFNDFYDAGLPKRNKERAFKIWNKLSESDRALAYSYVRRYLGTLKPSIDPKYPDTYLNNKTWLD